VLPDPHVPGDVPAERGLRVIEVEGPIPFSTTGVMAAVAGPLAKAGVSMFPLGTYDTDYVLIRDADLDRALRALTEMGWIIAR
jgi:uncharacterized protein